MWDRYMDGRVETRALKPVPVELALLWLTVAVQERIPMCESGSVRDHDTWSLRNAENLLAIAVSLRAELAARLRRRGVVDA